jgi:UBX domain-containing protein 7
MEAALAASLGKEISTETEPSSPQASQLPPKIPQDSPSPPPTQPLAPVESNSSTSGPTLFSAIIPSDKPEPPQSPQTTRIQFRFPDGNRPLVRRFNKTDTIRDVFAFVKGYRNDDGEFELVFVGRRLLAEAEESGGNALEKTIVEAGLANGSLTVEV